MPSTTNSPSSISGANCKQGQGQLARLKGPEWRLRRQLVCITCWTQQQGGKLSRSMHDLAALLALTGTQRQRAQFQEQR